MKMKLTKFQQEMLDGKVVEWMEHVTNEQYQSSSTSQGEIR